MVSDDTTNNMPKIVALVPMRHHSERVPGKNYRLFVQRPLYHHIAATLFACPMITEVVIDTDSETIKQDVIKEFPKVRLIDRPHHLRAETIPMNDVLLHDVSQVDADYYLQTHSTNPLLTKETISKAIKTFLENHSMYDSLFSVTKYQVRLWDKFSRAINHNPEILLRTQDLEPVFQENSCLYIFSRETLEKRHNRIGEHPLLFEIDRIESWDIDDQLDFEIAELLYLKYRKEKM